MKLPASLVATLQMVLLWASITLGKKISSVDDNNLDDFCSSAQKVIARTRLTSTNTVFDELGVAGVPFPIPTPSTEFIASISTPYGPEGEEGGGLPLTTTQHVGYGIDDSSGEEYPQTVLCKMKNAEALNYHFPDERPPARHRDCSLINKRILRKLRRRLGANNRNTNNVIFDDWITFAGNQWTAGSPAPTAYLDHSGRLHVVAKSLNVDRLDPSPFVTDERKGIQYCQVVAPKYLYKILMNEVTPPTCDPPPLYEIPTQGPPQVLPWECANP